MNSGLGTGIGEFRIFRQETISGVDCIHVGITCHPQNVFNIQIGANGFVALAHRIAFISFETVKGEPVLVRENRNGANAKFVGSSQNTNRDFATVGDQKFTDTLRCRTRH